MRNASHVLATLNRRLFQSRDDKAYCPVNPPLIYLVAVLAAISLVMYVAGDSHSEFQLRVSSLLLIGAATLIFLFSRWSDTLARWMVVPVLSIVIVILALWWKNAEFLFLLIIPVALAAVLINLPALLISALTSSLLILRLGDFIPLLTLSRDVQIALLTIIWLLVSVLGGGYIYIAQFIQHVNEDHDRFQKLLEESRDQQLKLGQAMDNLLYSNRQLSLLYDKNITLRKTAEEAQEAKTTYIARVSHEIRTPLTMILGITDCIIENEKLEEDMPLDLLDDIHVIRRNSEHLLSLLNDVLDLTRAQAGQLILKKEWVDINTEIEKAVEIVHPLVMKKKLSLLFDPRRGGPMCPPGSPPGSPPGRSPGQGKPAYGLPPVYCDRTRIRQVILNLLSNAVRYTDAGQVGIHAFADDQWLTVKVWDTGPGVLPDDLERIFEPFYRGTNSIRHNMVGAGLGLSVSRQLVELHSGKIWLESQPGAGSTFYFKLPVTIGEGPVRSPIGFISESWIWTERKQPELNIQSNCKRVVVCESEDTFSSRFREDSNIEFIRTTSIPELVEALDNTPAHLVLINATSLNDLLGKLEVANASIKDTPIIGSVFTPLRDYVMKAGAVEFIQKPFNATRLHTAVRRAVPDPRRVLIVDDNLEVQQLIARVLGAQMDKAEFLLAATGTEAWQMIKSYQPDLILLDLLLPDMDGWQLMERLKKDPQSCGVPVILVSAYDPVDELPKSKLMVFARGDGISLDDFIHYALGNLA